MAAAVGATVAPAVLGMGQRDRVCGETGLGRDLAALGRGQVAPTEVTAKPSQLECLVPGQALLDDSQQCPADLDLDGSGRLLGSRERIEPTPSKAGALRDSRPTYRAERTALVRFRDQPLDVRPRLTPSSP